MEKFDPLSGMLIMVAADNVLTFCFHILNCFTVRYHSGGSIKLNARILHLAYMVYL
jgi:hypothetical protein